MQDSYTVLEKTVTPTSGLRSRKSAKHLGEVLNLKVKNILKLVMYLSKSVNHLQNMEAVKHLKANYCLRMISLAPPSSSSQLLSYGSLILSFGFTYYKFTGGVCVCVTAKQRVLYLNFTKACCLHQRTLLILPAIDSFVMSTLEYWIFLKREVHYMNMWFQKQR